jgi:alpha-glucoside transport system permease protein
MKKENDSFFRKSILRSLGRLPVQIFMIFVAVFWLIPALGLFFQSLRTGPDIGQSGWWTVFSDIGSLTLGSYISLLQEPGMFNAFLNTFKIAIPATFFVVLIAAAAGYALSWLSFKGKETIFLVIVGLMVVPTQMAFIPMARILNLFGLFGSIPGVVIFHITFGLPFAVFLLRNFFVGIPKEILESAYVDGASHFTIFTRIILPLAMPAIASLTILQFLWTWNDMLIALIFASPKQAPLTTAIFRQMRNFSSNVDVIAPGAFLQLMIPLLIFFFFQRYFVQGLLGGAVKD